MKAHTTRVSRYLAGDDAGSSRAVVFRAPQDIELQEFRLPRPERGELVVDIAYSGISTGTERLLWRGDMPSFPGMGYPLVPGYESVGQVIAAGDGCDTTPGDWVFVPGARCFGDVRGLFGGTASRLVVEERRVLRIDADLGERGTLVALAATAHHALRPEPDTPLPELIVGHGVLGRLLARLVVALGGAPPTVWEREPDRRDDASGYRVASPDDDDRTDYAVIADASGDPSILDTLVMRLAPRGEIVLAGFYAAPLSFQFPPAFMREARFRVAAEWQPADFAAVSALIRSGALSLDGLITHRSPATQADAAYRVAFDDPACLKMILEWEGATEC